MRTQHQFASYKLKPHAKEQLLADLQYYRIGISIISESRFTKHHSAQFSALQGYVVHRLDRLERGGGGVAIYMYVSDQYDSVICSTSVDNRDYELLWVLVKRRSSVILVGGLYHPPKYSYRIQDILGYIEATLDELLHLHPNASVILASDFNKLNVDCPNGSSSADQSANTRAKNIGYDNDLCL